ncbi:hypothetical protein J6524_21175 [Bradyrhizobium sp. WSM 1738]|uniref:hypothetical protein n=1 Tax=Bradyrhizobium hereditatis TaxID=2821405 RepID=UPI001CE34FF2|nr:hypothetical protein [Bradyrhizobium hereditatis]MCA6117362.1 hypothetical protein [Bradyrhizobium hereditatis]
MHELTHPVELRDEELDLVAAGGDKRGHDKCCDGDNTQFGLVNVNDTNIGVNVLGIQVQST